MRNRLFVLDLGRMELDNAVIFGDLAEADPESSGRMICPILGYLIEEMDGRTLYDTGCHPAAMNDNGRWSESFKRSYPWFAGPDGEDCHLPNRLEQLGVGPDDIDRVVLSHMHSDHAGCVEFFEKSRIIVHRAERDTALAYHARRDPDSSYAWKDTAQWLTKELEWCLVEEEDTEIRLTNSITLLNWNAGHAAGMLGLSICMPETGHVILASDAVFTLENFGPPYRPAGYSLSPSRAAGTVSKIRQRAQQLQAQVWCGHDMKQFRTLRTSTTGWYE